MVKNKEHFDYLPEKAIDALKLWDKGENLWSVEMGGLGPSYEQSIQFSVFEIIRELKGITPIGNTNTVYKRLDAALARVDKKFDIGHSGATAGASKYLAYRFMKFGYRKTLQDAPKGRTIQVDKNFGKFKMR